MRKSLSDKNFEAHAHGSHPQPDLAGGPDSIQNLVLRATSRGQKTFAEFFHSRDTCDRAIDSLFTIWGQLPRSARRQLLSQSEPRVIQRLRHCAISDEPALRRAVAIVPRFTPIPASIDLLSVLLYDAEPEVFLEAERTLHALADNLKELRFHQRDALEHTAIEILQSFSAHHRTEAISAVERLGPWLGAVWQEWLDDADDADLMLLRSAIRRADDEHAPSRAVGWLAIPSVAGAAIEQLTTYKRDDVIQDATRASHLLRVPSRSTAIRARRKELVASALDSLSERPELDTLGRIAWTRSIQNNSFSIPPQVAREALVHSNPSVRWPIAKRCAELAPDSSEAFPLLQDFAFDIDQSIARSSVVALLTEHADVPVAQLDSFQRSPHESVRRFARLHSLPKRRWEKYAALRVRYHQSPDIVIAKLRGQLAHSSRTIVLSALRKIERLALTKHLEKDILGLLQHKTPRICATAVALAGTLDSAASKAAIATVFTHDDPRVRANTIESVSRHDPQAPIVIRAAFDDIPRLRANSIRARFDIDHSEAAGLLDAMLVDDRPDHRLSALWVTQRVAATGLNTRVASMADAEPDIRVQKRAKTCARALLARMRTSELPSPIQMSTSDTHAAPA